MFMLKRICFFSGDITRGGGTERLATRIMNALVQDGSYQVSVLNICMAHKQIFPLDSKIYKHALSEHWIDVGPGYFKIYPLLISYLKEQHVDILVDIDNVLDILSIPAARICGIKVISWDNFSYDFASSIWYRPLIRQLSVRFADQIVVLGNHDKEAYLQNFNMEKKPVVICNPIPDPNPSIRKNFNEKIIVSAGRLVKLKGFASIPQIVSILKKKNRDLKFRWLIAGQGEEKEKIEEEIRKYDTPEVELCGFISNMSAFYQKGLVFVLTSSTEGLPMVVLEALSNGLPCLSYPISGELNEVLHDGENGYFVDNNEEMAERLLQLLTDENLYQNMHQKALQIPQEYTMPYVIQQWKELFESLK